MGSLKGKNKCYAIIAGGEEHIVDTWEECQRIRDENPSGAQYKGFKSRMAAAAWLVEMGGGVGAAADEKKEERPAYAVLHGWQPGIYTSYANCKAQINGLTNVCFRKFQNEDMAKRWLEMCQAAETNGPVEGKEVRCYTDGSYNQVKMTWGYGVYMFEEGNEENNFIFQGHGQRNFQHWNVTGECYGAICGVQEAIRMGFSKIYILYDYEGIEKWATYEWEAKTEFTQAYTKRMYALGTQIKIEFQKVKAHSGETYNEIVDGLAKQAAGLI